MRNNCLLLTLLFSSVCFSTPSIIECPEPDYAQSSEFVYCGPAICTTNSDKTTATCNDCMILIGRNYGTTLCSSRIPTTNSSGQKVLISSFTPRTVNLPGVLQQPLVYCRYEGDGSTNTSYADCLGATCTVTDEHKKLASCTCNIVNLIKGQSFATQTRSCASPNKCLAPSSSELLNGTPSIIADSMLKTISLEQNSSPSDYTCNKFDHPEQNMSDSQYNTASAG